MDMRDLVNRLDRIEAKLDQHLEKVIKNEQDISWLRGHLKVATTLFLSLVSGMAAILAHIYFRE